MKNLKLILLVVLGAFLFNSCEDKDEDKTENNNYPTIVKLKSLVGISSQSAESKIIAMGYTLQDTSAVEEVAVMYMYQNANHTNTYIILKYNNLICASSYDETTPITIALTNFEKFSKECIEYMVGKTTIYDGVIYSQVGDEHYETHQNFLTYYQDNKLNIGGCEERWETTTETVFCQYDKDDTSAKSSLIYMNMQLLPPGFITDKTIKTLFGK